MKPTTPLPFERLFTALLSDSMDGTLSKDGRAYAYQVARECSADHTKLLENRRKLVAALSSAVFALRSTGYDLSSCAATGTLEPLDKVVDDAMDSALLRELGETT